MNDTYGHAAGDEVLREIACRLRDSVRTYDAVSRYGGEEFLIVLNGCRTQMGANRAENIRHAIEEPPVETATGPLAVSMSLGVAGTGDWQDSNAEQLIGGRCGALSSEGVGPEPGGTCEAFRIERNPGAQDDTGSRSRGLGGETAD